MVSTGRRKNLTDDKNQTTTLLLTSCFETTADVERSKWPIQPFTQLKVSIGVPWATDLARFECDIDFALF